MYYTAKRELPASLSELAPYSPSGTILTFVCQESGKSYIYVPQGLTVPGQDRILIMYDAAPAHHGHRFGIVAMPQRLGRPLTTQVIRLDEPVLQAYLKSAPK